MSFGRNPHVDKALAAVLKAEAAPDQNARSRAYLEAARLWDRAAEREKPGKQRTEYERNAARERELAESPVPSSDDSADEPPPDPSLLN